MRVRGLRQLFHQTWWAKERDERGVPRVYGRIFALELTGSCVRGMHAGERKTGSLRIMKKNRRMSHACSERAAFCFRLPCVDRVDHETRLYAAQNVNESTSDPETCYLRRVIVHFWYRYFLSLEFDERNCFFFLSLSLFFFSTRSARRNVPLQSFSSHDTFVRWLQSRNFKW